MRLPQINPPLTETIKGGKVDQFQVLEQLSRVQIDVGCSLRSWLFDASHHVPHRKARNQKAHRGSPEDGVAAAIMEKRREIAGRNHESAPLPSQKAARLAHRRKNALPRSRHGPSFAWRACFASSARNRFERGKQVATRRLLQENGDREELKIRKANALYCSAGAHPRLACRS